MIPSAGNWWLIADDWLSFNNNIVQNFHISANTSEDTKRLVTQTIKQATPSIAKYTKSDIINDRKRGGSMKAALG